MVAVVRNTWYKINDSPPFIVTSRLLGVSEIPGSKIHKIQQQTQNFRSKILNAPPHFMSSRIQDPSTRLGTNYISMARAHTRVGHKGPSPSHTYEVKK